MIINGEFNANDSLTIVLSGIPDAVSFLGFIDTTDETADKYFKKEFRYSQNSQFSYTDWLTLSNAVLQSQVLNLYRIVWMEVRYTREGTDLTGVLNLDFLEIQVSIDNTLKPLYPTVFSNPNHIFGHILVNNVEWQTYCINLMKKLWAEGIVAKFVNRSDEYWYFFKTVACYLSLYYIYAKEIEDLFKHEGLLREYLSQRNLFLCGGEDLGELQSMAGGYFNKIRKRGTTECLPEIEKVLCNRDCDEFILKFIHNNYTGWFINNTSPNYTSLENIESINKLPVTIISKTDLIWLNDNLVTMLIDTVYSIDKNVFEINNFSSQCGVKYNKTFDKSDKFIFNLDSGLDYEVSFSLKQINPLTKIEFGIDLFDCEGNLLDAIDLVTGNIKNNFIETTDTLNYNPKTEYVNIKACLCNKDEALRADCKLNIGVGNYLKMPANVSFGYPRIIIHAGANKVRIADVRVALLSHKFPIASYIELSNFVLAYFKNNNKIRSDFQTRDLIDKYLLPLECQLDFNLL
jgi:hypothetical protein